MSVTAIIPARGGSKGITRKNLQTIDGVSLIGRAVNSAKRAKSVDRVYVSTDSHEIALEAEKHAAVSIIRTDELSLDSTSSEAVIQDAIPRIGAIEIVVFVQCTSPFIESSDIDEAVAMVRDGGYDSVFSAVEDHGFRWERNGEFLRPILHSSKNRPRRQDLPNRFLETGAFYVFRSEGFQKARSRFFGRIGLVLVNKLHQIDIDTIQDLDMARKLAKIISKRETVSDWDPLDP